MKQILLFAVGILSVLSAHAQFTAKDRITITHTAPNTFPGLLVTSHDALRPGGHPFLWMRNFGGTANAPSATLSDRLLGTLSFGGHDGQTNVQAARISVLSTGTFAKGKHPVKMIFKVGGSATCCGAERMAIDGNTGHVGIGTTAPRNRLDVNGTIRSREIKVEASPWPDFVFEKDYALMSLADTEKYIDTHGHLPAIPAAGEVAANGVALGEMNAKLLQKIEELTLHLIAQQKSIKAQDERIETLENELNQLRK